MLEQFIIKQPNWLLTAALVKRYSIDIYLYYIYMYMYIAKLLSGFSMRLRVPVRLSGARVVALSR